MFLLLVFTRDFHLLFSPGSKLLFCWRDILYLLRYKLVNFLAPSVFMSFEKVLFAFIMLTSGAALPPYVSN